MKVKRILAIGALVTCVTINQLTASDMFKQAKKYVAELFQGSTQKEKVADLFMNPAFMPESLYDTFLATQSSDEQTKKQAIQQIAQHMSHLEKQISLLAIGQEAAKKKINLYLDNMDFGISDRFNVYYMPNLFATVMDAMRYTLPRERYALKFLRSIGNLANKIDDEADSKNKAELSLRKFIVQSLKEFDTTFRPFVHAAKMPKISTLTQKQILDLINAMWIKIKRSEQRA